MCDSMNMTLGTRGAVNDPDTTRSAQFDWLRGLVMQDAGVSDVPRGDTAAGPDNGPRAGTAAADLLAVFEILGRIPG